MQVTDKETVMAKKVRKKMPVKKVCAWCNRVLQEGSEPATHGICEPCGKKVIDRNERLTFAPLH
jgi:rRNA maturation endonuclease Nob1